MHPETINTATRAVLEKIAKTDFIHQFYLAGGTALALELGHRISIDLDFFTYEKFSTAHIRNTLAKLGSLTIASETSSVAGQTLNGILDEVQVSFFIYPYQNVYPTIEYAGVRLADERDIAAMKLEAIASRGSKKDFVDLYVLMEKYSLSQLITFFEKRYSNVEYNKLHLLKSLSYFADAEESGDPVMLKKLDWQTVKEKISKAARDYLH